VESRGGVGENSDDGLSVGTASARKKSRQRCVTHSHRLEIHHR
jgi:hypothetical protein